MFLLYQKKVDAILVVVLNFKLIIRIFSEPKVKGAISDDGMMVKILLY